MKSHMTPRAVPLGDLLHDVRSGFACGEDFEHGLAHFRMNNVTIEGRLNWDKIRRVSEDSLPSAELLLRPGDVLFNATNSPELIGKTAIFLGRDEPVAFSNHFIRLRADNRKLDSAYLTHWMHRLFERGVFRTMCRQWVNQASIGRERLLELIVPLPPLEEQRRIAAILNKADALRHKRRAALQKLDSLTQSLFLDMFGDPISNPKGWPLLPIADIGAVITGNTPSREKPDYFGEAIEWVKSDNLNTPHYYVTRATEGLSDAGKAVARIAPPYSILVTCIAGSPNCIGNAAMTDREVAFNQQINALIPKESEPHFLYAEILLAKRKIQHASTHGMKGMVSKSRFEKITLPVPPSEMQREYARRVAPVRHQIAAQRESIRQLELLLAALQHRAFREEL